MYNLDLGYVLFSFPQRTPQICPVFYSGELHHIAAAQVEVQLQTL
jgi:hypothetical protein